MKCRFWKPSKGGCTKRLIQGVTVCPDNCDPTDCHIITHKTVILDGVLALNKEGEVYSIRTAIDSDTWDKRVWKKCKIHYEAKLAKGEL